MSRASNETHDYQYRVRCKLTGQWGEWMRRDTAQQRDWGVEGAIEHGYEVETRDLVVICAASGAQPDLFSMTGT